MRLISRTPSDGCREASVAGNEEFAERLRSVVGHAEVGGLAEVTFADESDVESRHAVGVVPVERPVVEDEVDVADGVYMAVKVEVAVAEGVGLRAGRVGQGLHPRSWCNGAGEWVGGEHNVAEDSWVGRLAQGDVYRGPGGAGVGEGLARGVRESEAALAEQSVGGFYPGGHGVGFVYAGEA